MDSQVPFNCCDQIASIKLLTAKVKNNKKKKEGTIVSSTTYI